MEDITTRVIFAKIENIKQENCFGVEIENAHKTGRVIIIFKENSQEIKQAYLQNGFSDDFIKLSGDERFYHFSGGRMPIPGVRLKTKNEGLTLIWFDVIFGSRYQFTGKLV